MFLLFITVPSRVSFWAMEAPADATKTKDNLMNFSGSAGDMLAAMKAAGIQMPDAENAAKKAAAAPASKPAPCTDPTCTEDHDHSGHEHAGHGHDHEHNSTDHDHGHKHEHAHKEGHAHSKDDHKDCHSHGHTHEHMDHPGTSESPDVFSRAYEGEYMYNFNCLKCRDKG